MSELRELYQEMILDHSQKPHNFGDCEKIAANLKQEGFNPLCGDKIILNIREKNNVIEEICFEGSGCAISMASASLMTDALKGKTIKEALNLFREFQKMLVLDGKKNKKINWEKLGKLKVLAGVKEFPIRIKCATLAWHALRSALQEDKKI
jgi:nitrogen fixation protein NifU and related proteins